MNDVISTRLKLISMEVGDRRLFLAKSGGTSALMRQLGSDISRAKEGKWTQTQFLGVSPKTKEVIEIVMVERTA